MLGLYIHIPFCKSRCIYCDFYSETNREGRSEDLITAMCLEWKLLLHDELKGNPPLITSIYFGGGTPSLLEPRDVERLLSAIKNKSRWDRKIEITLEANPESVTLEKAEAWRSMGINRISLGVQSLEARCLLRLGRIHTAEQALRSYEILSTAGFNRINLDLIYGVDRESSHGFRKSVESIRQLDPGHISCYLLTAEKGTPLQARIDSGEWLMAGEECEADDYFWTRDALTGAGYEPYEISSFARPGHRSIHNERYWTRDPYLGIGPGAHSLLNERRWYNRPNLDTYLDSIMRQKIRPVTGYEELTQRQIAEERLFLGLRRREGLDWRRFTLLVPPGYREKTDQKCHELVQLGYLSHERGRVALTEKALFISNTIVVELISMLDGWRMEPLPV